VFTAINQYQNVRLYLARHSVVLSEDEQKLYDMGFRSLRPREFVSLVLAGEWKTTAPGDQVLTEGKPVSSICVAVSGAMQIRRQDKEVMALGLGHLIGTGLALTGTPSPIGAVFTESARYLCWSLGNLRAFLDRRPELRVTLKAS
jgi:CRP-like cAMP-binding protein